MKILHTADWHIGSFKGPEKDGVNLRGEDTMNCLRELVRVAQEKKPELTLVSGDIFHQAEIWQGRSHREVLQAREIIMKLAEVSENVVVMRGTPNHDSAEAFAELQAHFELVSNVEVVTEPKVINTLMHRSQCSPDLTVERSVRSFRGFPRSRRMRFSQMRSVISWQDSEPCARTRAGSLF